MQPKRDNPADYEMEEYKAWRRRVFWTRVSKKPGLGPHGECWEWIAGGTRAGYGNMYFAGRHHYAHRISWFIAYGVWPTLHICHKCDNPPCVNPDHLFEGDDAANTADKIAKGRARHPGVRGEDHGMAKLTGQEVMEIRRRFAIGESLSNIARRYNVVDGCIGLIVTGKSWPHLPLIPRPESVKPDYSLRRTPKGKNHARAKLTAEDVGVIKEERLRGTSQRTLARRFGVVPHTIQAIEYGRSWKSLLTLEESDNA